MLSKEAKLKYDYETYGQEATVVGSDPAVSGFILHRPSMQAFRQGEMAYDAELSVGSIVKTFIDEQKFILAEVQDEAYQDTIVKKLVTLVFCNAVGNIYSISSGRDAVSLMEEETPVLKYADEDLLMTYHKGDAQLWVRGQPIPIFEGECFISNLKTVEVGDRIVIGEDVYVAESISARFAGVNAVKLGEDKR